MGETKLAHPGPWKIQPSGGGCFDIVAGRKREHVARVVYADDARLIASAPDLYEALADMLSVVYLVDDDSDRRGTIENAGRVLARARGESP
jgi:hypothetical protein